MKRLAIILALLSFATAAGAQAPSPDGLTQSMAISEEVSWSGFSSSMNLTGEPLSRATLPSSAALPEAPKSETVKADPPVYTYRKQEKPVRLGETHRFFDKRNTWLTVATFGVQTMDAVSTRYTLDHFSNVKEGSPIARPFENQGWPGTLAFHYGINAGGTLLFQYMAHRSGHHTLERWMPVITIGQSLQGSIMNFRAQSYGVPKK
jgi:hypothetical protein